MAFPNRAQRGYVNLLYPRIATTNGLGSTANINGGTNHFTAETFKRFGLNIAANSGVNGTTLKQASAENILLFYQNITQMQVNTVALGVPFNSQTIWPGWWLTNTGTTLNASLSAVGGTGISMTLNGQPGQGFFGCQVATLNADIVTTGSPVASTWTGVKVPGSSNSWATMAAYTNGASVIIDSGANFEVVTISSVSTNSTTVTFTATYTKTHLTGSFVGLLPFPALISTTAHTTDEVVLVTGQTAANVYTVTRGTTGSPIWGSPYGGAANPPAHAVGDRVAALINTPAYITTFYLNAALVCPACPISASSGPNQLGQKWVDYFATLVQATIGATTFTDNEGITRPVYDGIFIDSANTFLNPAIPWGDADANNQGDTIGGDGPSPGPSLYPASGTPLQGAALGHGIFNGIVYALRALRNLATNAPQVILTNGSNYPLLGDGIYWESIESDSSNPKAPAIVLYRPQQQAGVNPVSNYPYPVTVYNYDLGNSNNLAGTQTVAGQGSAQAVYKNARMYFAAVTCLTDGFFCLDYGPLAHGQTWMLDEMDGAAGTCLTTALTTGATSLVVRSTTGFNTNDTIRIPMDKSTVPVNLGEDEVMTVSAVTDSTHLAVTRGITYNGVVQTAGTAQIGSRVQTLAMQNAGQGWLKNPRGAGTTGFSGLGANQLLNPGFETATPGTIGPGFGATFTSWTVSNTAYNLDTGNAYSGFAMVETNNPHSGTRCLKFVTTCPFKSAFYDLVATQTVSGGSFPSASAVTCSFWARGDRNQIIEARVVDVSNGSATISVTYVQISPIWAQYWVTAFIGGSSSTSVKFQLGFANENGTVWVDDCAMQTGDPNLFQRDFDNGYVIANLTNASKVVTLPAITGPWTNYQKLNGSQDPTTNDGTTVAPGATVTVPALDGIFLRKV